MSLENGLYVIRFATPLGDGTGVAYLVDGQLRGGDSMMAYSGDYQGEGDVLTAVVRAYKHSTVADMASVFGVDEVEIHLTGSVSGGTAALTGTAPQAPGIALEVSMQRLQD